MARYPVPAAVLLLALATLIHGAPPVEAQSTLPPVVSAADELRLGAWIQPAWRYQGRSGEDDLQGFFLRRARLDLSGSVLDGRVRFRLLPDLSSSPELRDAWVELRGENAASLRMGQQSVPFDLQRERSMAAGHFGDRAIAARRFELSGGRDLGVVGSLRARGGQLQLRGGAFTGQGANRRDPGRSPLLAGRASVSMGGLPASGESDLARSPSPVLTLSAGAMRARNSFLRPRPGFSADRTVAWHGWTLDAHARWRGASAAGAWFSQEVDAEGNDEQGEGFFLSAGWVLPWHDAEVVFRHSEATWDLARDAGADTETALGLTLFHQGHGLQTRIQLARELLESGSPAERRVTLLTIEHQLLLGG